MRWAVAILVFLSTVVAAAWLGIASASTDPTLAGAGEPPVLRCADAPPLPSDAWGDRWGSDALGVTLFLTWFVGSGSDKEPHEIIIRVDDPTCAKRPDIQKFLAVDETPPRFEDAYVVVRPGQPRAYVGYTMIDDVGELFASLDGITAKNAAGRAIAWNHQTATGGGYLVAANGREVAQPATDVAPYELVGDADYFNAADLKVGETITVTFRFKATQDAMDDTPPTPKPRAIVNVPFKVVAAR